MQIDLNTDTEICCPIRPSQSETDRKLSATVAHLEPSNTTMEQQAPSGTIFVSEYSNHTIRQITPDGTVSTLCGSPGEKGSADGKGSAARFTCPSGIAVSPNGTLFVTDKYNYTI